MGEEIKCSTWNILKKNMIYFDNSATTYPKPRQVINAVNESFIKYGANPGRSGHSFAINSANKLNQARNKVAEFFGAENPEKVIFTSGCTSALNLAILGTAQEGGHIISTINEHNSVLRPLFTLKETHNIEISIAKPSEEDKITLEDIVKHIKLNTYLIICNHISNVDGMECDIENIGNYCNEHCIKFLVDGAQSAGHKKYNLIKQHIDMLAIAGHKGLYSLMGVGVLIINNKTKLKPIIYGGTGTESENPNQPSNYPEGFESGTLALPNIISLDEGVNFVQNNFFKIKNKIEDLTTYLNFELDSIENIKVYTHPNNTNGVISFNIGDIYSSEVSQELDNKFGIMTRSGLHCAPLKHKFMNTLEQGTVRVSLSYFNTFDECQKLIKAVKYLKKYY